jgi:hypothetical protein
MRLRSNIGLWRGERALQSSRVLRLAMLIVTAGALISLAIAALAAVRWHAEDKAAQSMLDATAAPARGVTMADQADFAASLPPIDHHKPFLLEVDRAAQAANVAFVSSTITPASVATGQLRRTEVTIRLRGGYPAQKQVFKEVLERFAHATVTRLRMNTSSPSVGGSLDAVAPGVAVEAVWVVSLWSAALPAATAPASR